MKMRTVAVVGVLSALCVAIIIAVVVTSVTGAPAEQQDNVITKAIVVFNVGTVGDDGVKGTLELTQKDASSPVHINGTLTGLKPKGLHGFHIHESGDIREGCKSARGHFNPKKMEHGAPTDATRHFGDLGNINADDAGTALIDIEDPLITLNGDYNVLGRAFVVHALVDDLGKTDNPDSKKTGNAGGRLACGLIGVF